MPNSISNAQHIQTLDDALDLARALLTNLTDLSAYKYPFAIRKGVRDVTAERENKEGLVLKSGATTYFLDIRETKQGDPFLSITESRGKGEGKGFERRTINVFADQVEEFSKLIYRTAGEVVRRSKAKGGGNE